MEVLRPNVSQFRSLLIGGLSIAFLGCTHTSVKQTNVSAQPPAQEKQSGAVLLLDQTSALIEGKKFYEAIELYKQIIVQFPKEARAFDELIFLSRHQQDSELEIQTAIQYRTEFPHSPHAILLHAIALENNNQSAEAELLYEYGMQKFPENSDMILGKVLALHRQNKIAESLKLLDDKIAESDKCDSKIYGMRAQFTILGAGKDKASKLAASKIALPFLIKALEKEPDNVSYLSQKAEIELLNKMFDDSIKTFEKIHEIQPENLPLISAKLIPLYVALKRFEDAFEKIELLASHNYKDAPSVFDFSFKKL